MAFSQIFHHEQGLGFAGSTTSSVNSTGAKLLIIKVAFIPANDTPDVSDSKSNTWIPLSIYQGGTGGGDGTAPGNVGVRFYYCINPTVGSGHTFTVTKNFTYISVSVTGWSCPNTPVYDKQAGGGSTGVGSRSTGSVTPAADNSLIVSAVANDVNDTYTPDSSLSTIGSVNFAASNNRGITSGYVLQTTKTAINVTWTKSSGTANMAAAIAVFFDSADTPPSGDFSLVCGQGSFTLTGQNANLVKTSNYSLTCGTGSFSLTGQNANLTKAVNFSLVCGPGTFALFGKDVEFIFVELPSSLEQFFEELQLSKLLNITQLDLDMPLLSADFGDGYGAGVLSGKESGLRFWTIGSECLPDQDAWSIDYTVDDEDLTDTRFQYFWEFFRRHIALGNKPFWFRDPRTGRQFMASFIDKQISFEALTAKLYAGGISIKQRRVVMDGITFRTEDGSVEE